MDWTGGIATGAGLLGGIIGNAMQTSNWDEYSKRYRDNATTFGYGGQAQKDLISRSDKSKKDAESFFSRSLAGVVEQNRSEREKRFAAQGIRSNVFANEGVKADTARGLEKGYDAFSGFSLNADAQREQGLLGYSQLASKYDELDMNANAQQQKYENRWADMVSGIGEQAVGVGMGMLGQSWGNDQAKTLWQETWGSMGKQGTTATPGQGGYGGFNAEDALNGEQLYENSSQNMSPLSPSNQFFTGPQERQMSPINTAGIGMLLLPTNPNLSRPSLIHGTEANTFPSFPDDGGVDDYYSNRSVQQGANLGTVNSRYRVTPSLGRTFPRIR